MQNVLFHWQMFSRLHCATLQCFHSYPRLYPFIYLYIYIFIYLYIYIFVYLYICIFIYLYIYIFIYLYIYIFVYLYIYIFIYLYIYIFIFLHYLINLFFDAVLMSSQFPFRQAKFKFKHYSPAELRYVSHLRNLPENVKNLQFSEGMWG